MFKCKQCKYQCKTFDAAYIHTRITGHDMQKFSSDGTITFLAVKKDDKETSGEI